jgi:3-oxoacyl-[acyl-carrier protein] reductase
MLIDYVRLYQANDVETTEDYASGMSEQTSRTALVTGASRGLGAAMAVALAEAGHRVAVNYYERASRAEDLCAGLRARGLTAQAFQADVRDEANIARMISEIEAGLGAVEVLVVNATGHQPMLSIEQQTWQSYLDQMEFFVKSPLLLMQAVLPTMRERSFGRVIQIGSEVVELGNARFANYIAAKAAQLGQTRSWAQELGASGITVNLIAPGWIPTERAFSATEAEKNAYAQSVPMRRMGIPEEVGRVVAFLASDDASFITGQKLSVNGGNTLE